MSPQGIEFNFEDSLGGDTFMWNGNPLLLSQVHGISSGSLTDPNFTIDITFKQYLKKFLLQEIEKSFTKAHKAVQEEFKAAHEQINKVYPLVDSMKHQVAQAQADVDKAKLALEKIDAALAETTKAYAQAQAEVDTLNTAIKTLDELYKQHSLGNAHAKKV